MKCAIWSIVRWLLPVLALGCSGSLASERAGADGGPDTSGPFDASPGNDAHADAADAGGDARPDAPDSASYLAYAIAGGLDLIVILKRDPLRKLCFDLRLRAPGTNTSTVAVPAYWALESARVWNDDAACVKGYAGGATSFNPTSQSGSITFPGTPAVPQTIASLAVTLTFPGGPPWSEVLAATNLPVQ